MRKRRAGEAEESVIDLTPAIDIVFNLLIFFVCASKLRSEEGLIRAFLPKDRGPNSSSQAPTLVDTRIVIRPAGEGRVRVRLGQPLGEVAVAGARTDPVWSLLREKLESLKAGYRGDSPDGLPVVVDASPDVPTSMVVLAVNEVLRAGLRDLTFAMPEKPWD